MFKLIISIIFLYSSLYANLQINENFQPKNRDYFKKLYGKNALKRVDIVIHKLENIQNESTLVKLKTVNNLFNKFSYLEDTKHWKKNNYWAPPLDFIATGAGDSEDFALSKYIALVSLGIDKNNLQFMEYKNKSNYLDKSNEYIVLAYFHKKNTEPIILDKTNRKLRKTNLEQLSNIKLIHSVSLWNKKLALKQENIIETTNGKELAKIFNIKASSKIIKQWQRIFKKDRKLKKYNLDKLKQVQLDALLDYLIMYSADSDLVEAAGI